MIVHPRFRDVFPVTEESDEPRKGSRPDPDLEMDLSMMPTHKKRAHRINDGRLQFTFHKSLSVAVQSQGAEPRVVPKSGTVPEAQKEFTSAGHGEHTGTARELDVGVNRDSVEEEAPPELKGVAPNDRFPLFERVIDQLTSDSQYDLKQINCYELPDPDTGSFAIYRTKTGERLQCYVAIISYRKEDLAIIEVDVGSLRKSKAISTLIVGFDSGGQGSKESISEILLSCANAGVLWKMEKIRAIASVAENCYHPRREQKSGRTSRKLTLEEYQQKWVSIIQKKLNSIWRADS